MAPRAVLYCYPALLPVHDYYYVYYRVEQG